MSDVIDPGYYADQPVEPIEAIEQVCGCLDGYEGYLMGNVIKYVMRAGRKTEDPSEDLGKAANYAYRLVTGHWLESSKEDGGMSDSDRAELVQMLKESEPLVKKYEKRHSVCPSLYTPD